MLNDVLSQLIKDDLKLAKLQEQLKDPLEKYINLLLSKEEFKDLLQNDLVILNKLLLATQC